MGDWYLSWKFFPWSLRKEQKNCFLDFLKSCDSVKRGYALRALINAQCLDRSLVPDNIKSDKSLIYIFDGWNFIETRISDMASFL